MRMRFMHLFALAAIPVVGSSQTFNTTFYDNNSIYGKKVTVIPHQPGPGDDEIIFTSDYYGGGGTAPTQLLITKTDNQGNFMQAILQDRELSNHHIVTTYDDGILIAGSPNPASGRFELVVMKYDNNLNLQWSKLVPLSSRLTWTEEEIDIATNIENGKEYYYIACNEGNPEASLSNFSAFAVVKIDETGTLAWHQTYATSGGDYGATAIVRYQDQGQNLFCIAGNQNVGTGLFDCYMAIDETGHIVHQLRHHHSNHWVRNPDLIWDGTSLVFIDTDYNPSQIMPCNTSPVIGMFRLKPDLTQYLDPGSLNPIEYYYFYACEQQQLKAQGITLDPSSGDYIVSFSWMDHGRKHAGYYALDPANMTIRYYSHTTYNFFRDKEYDRQEHFTDVDGNNYFVPSITSPGPVSPRLIKTDASFISCGVTNPNFLRKQDVSSAAVLFQCSAYTTDQVFPYTVTEWAYTLSQDFCNNAGNPDYYRLAPGAELTTAATVYPKITQKSNQTITCNINSDISGTVEIAIYNLNGQLMYRQNQTLIKGANNIVINGRLAPGVNVLKISSGGKLIQTDKLVLVQ